MPHKQKKNTEEKVRIVRQYLQREISITRAAELGDVDRDTMRKCSCTVKYHKKIMSN